MSQYLVHQIAGKANISVETGTQVVSVAGEHHLESIRMSRQNQVMVRREVDVLCVMIGANAATQWLPEALRRDEKGFVRTGRDITDLGNWQARRLPFHLETNLPGSSVPVTFDTAQSSAFLVPLERAAWLLLSSTST